MNLRNVGAYQALDRKGTKCLAFQFLLDCWESWFLAQPFFQWHKTRETLLYWAERFYSDWEQSNLS